MKKHFNLLMIAVLVILLIDMIAMGRAVNSMDPEQMILTAYVAGACMLVLFSGAVYKSFLNNRCPHCGRMQPVKRQYCPHCGKKID